MNYLKKYVVGILLILIAILVALLLMTTPKTEEMQTQEFKISIGDSAPTLLDDVDEENAISYYKKTHPAECYYDEFCWFKKDNEEMVEEVEEPEEEVNRVPRPCVNKPKFLFGEKYATAEQYFTCPIELQTIPLHNPVLPLN